jgi:hypothetical protein
MSLQDAHAFIVRLREQPERVALGETTMAGVIEAGRAAGFTFDEADLRAAHAHDWVLRWLALRSQTGSAGAGPEADSLAPNPRAKAR